MTFRTRTGTQAATMALLLDPTVASAALVAHTSSATFGAAVSARGLDTYSNFSLTGGTPSPITRTSGAYPYVARVSTTSFFGAGTTADPALSTNTATDSITFDAFPPSVFAVGANVYGSDINGNFALGAITVTATDSNATLSRTITGATTSSFLGFFSDAPPIVIMVTAVQPAAGFLWPTVDNFSLAQQGVTDRIFSSGFDPGA